jgi:Spy/CpxP family protein refolding chaperone
MEKDKFLIITIIILFVLNLFTLGYVIMGRGEHLPPPDMDDSERVVPLGDDPGDRGPRDMDPNRKKPGRPDEVIINRLKLNKDQILQFENLKNEHRKQTEELQFTSKKLHDEYFGLLKTDIPDTTKASQLLKDLGKNQEQLDKVTFEHFGKIKSICDKDQKLLFNTFIDEIAGSFKPPMPKK